MTSTLADGAMHVAGTLIQVVEGSVIILILCRKIIIKLETFMFSLICPSIVSDKITDKMFDISE